MRVVYKNNTLTHVVSPVQGATSQSAGAAGLVPAPLSTDVNKFLKGDGTWSEIDLSDIGEFPDLADVATSGDASDLSYDTTSSGMSATNVQDAIDEVSSSISSFTTQLSGKAPTNHASTDTTYGVGNATNYGHVKVDSTPTANSTNAISSGAVNSLKETLTNQINKNGAKNLLPFDLATVKKINTAGTWSGDSYTHSGITFTPEVDDKGNLLYVNVNGTNPSSTITASIVFWNSDVSPFYLQPNNYILTGTPSGGGHNTYNCYVKNGSNYESDLGNGKEFTISSASQGLAFVIVVGKGQTVSNQKFYPMIRLASDPDGTYEPYAMTNRQLTTDKVGMDLLSEVGAVNYLENTAVTAVDYGITWTVYDDKSMNANGTQNAPGNSVIELGYQSLKKGTYRLTGCPEDGGYNTSIQLYLPNDQYAIDYGDGAVFTLNEDASCRCNIWVKHNASFSNKVFKPMIAPVSYNGPYVPYAKSNKELTGILQKLLFNGGGVNVDKVSDLNTPLLNNGGATLNFARFLNNTTNAPMTGGGLVLSWASSPSYGAQFVLSDRGVYYRSNSAGTISDWQKLTT